MTTMTADTVTPAADVPTPDYTAPVSDTPDDVAPKPASKRPTTRAGRRAASAARKASTKADSKPKSSKPTPRRDSLEKRLSGSIAGIGTMVLVSGTVSGSAAVQADGELIVAHAPHIAQALDKVAKDNPRVAAALESMLTAGVWSGLGVALLPVALGIAANHGAIPPHIAAHLGIVAPAPVDPEGGSVV